MLLAFELKGFKSYSDATLTLGGNHTHVHQRSPLSVLIGANASGKTNLIEGLRLLSAIATGTRLDTIRGATANGPRGSLGTLGYRGASSFSFCCRTDFSEYEQYEITLELRDERLHIREERVWSASRVVPLFAIVEPSVGLASDVEVAYDNFARGGKKPRVTCTDQISLLTQMSSSARFQSSHKKHRPPYPNTADATNRCCRTSGCSTLGRGKCVATATETTTR